MLPFLIVLAASCILTPLAITRSGPPSRPASRSTSRPLRRMLLPVPVVAAAVIGTTVTVPAGDVYAAAPDPTDGATSTALSGDRLVAAPMAGYQLADVFGQVPGVTQVDPVGIADDGTIVGNYVHEGRPKAYRARPGQPFEELYATGAERIEVDAVAPDGRIAGHITTLAASDADGWIGTWSPDDEGNLGEFERRLAQPKGAPTVESVRAVNSRGDVLLGTSVLHADGTRTLLGHPRPGGGNPSLSALDMNEHGQVVGLATWTEFGRQVTRAVQWNSGVPVLQLQFGEVSAIADVIADNGTIGMRAATGTPEEGYRTWIVEPGLGAARPVAPASQKVLLKDINERGTAVGVIETSEGLRPVTFDGGTLRRLDQLVAEPTVHMQTAIGINTDGVITGDVDWQGTASVYLARPVNPVVFVHGAGASRLSQVAPRTDSRGDEGAEQWLSCGEDRMHLSRWPEDLESGRAMSDVRAFAPLRDETCHGIGSTFVGELGVYDDLLSHLEQSGFRPYRVEGRLDRYTADGCDTSQDSPNLFSFAYDWRQDNADSARRLADFMACVQRFWPDREVNVITHSMGSLVAQRYLLDTGAAAPVDRLITFGAPWLGSPKLVNVLFTGDFAKGPVNGPRSVIQRIVGSFPSAHQLMAGPYYEDLATEPVLVEAGMDLDGDGIDAHSFTFDEMAASFDAANPMFHPGATARDFQTAEGQVDWSRLATDFDVTHFVGLQAGRNTIGTVVGRNRVVCDVFGGFSCSQRDVVEQELVCGDGTVPFVSAARVGRGRDLNAPDAEVRTLQPASSSDNTLAEHTGITGNADALSRLDELLRTPSSRDLPGGYTGPVGVDGQDLDSCTGVGSGLTASTSAPDEDHALRYLRLLGGTDVIVTDDQRHMTPPDASSAGEVPGVTQYRSNRDDAGLTTLPVSSARTYRVAFRSTGEPLQLELLDGTQQAPTRAVRWMDIDAPEGAAELELRPGRTPVLRTDTDGDGEVDSPIEPTVDVTGTDALDVTAPVLTVTAIGSGDDRRYAVSAADDGAGAVDVKVATGEEFSTYDGPFRAATGARTLRAFATDSSGNRSPMTEIPLGSVTTAPLTTATRTPAANDRGWNDGAIDVQLAAEAAGGVRSITWWAEGATTVPPTTVDGDRASIGVTATGVTRLQFRATGIDGTVEPVRTLVVRIDTDRPSAQLQTPYPDSSTADLDRIAGTAADATSGIAAVDVEIRNSEGRSWDGDSWETPDDGPIWLAATVAAGHGGPTTFERRTDNPTDADLPQGAYRIRLRVTDGAGHRQVTDPARATVSESVEWEATALEPSSPSGASSTRSIDDRGAVLGSVSDGGARQVLWRGGTISALPVATGDEVTARTVDGSMVGTRTLTVDGTSTRHPMTWSGDGVETELALTPGTTSGWAVDRNDTGTVVGMTGNDGRFVDAVRWGPGGAERLSLPVAGSPTVTDVNDAGTIVGSVDPPNIGDVTPSRALRWDPDGTVHQLGTLGSPSRAPSSATAVNDLGVVVGSAWTDAEITGTQHAVVFADDQVRTVDNGLFTSGASAVDVNDRGWIVGNFTTRTGSLPRAFLSTDMETAVDLNTLLPEGSGWVLERVVGINELGQIAGFGTLDGKPRGFVLSTVHAPVAEDVVASAAGEARIGLGGWDADPADAITYRIVDGAQHGSTEILDGGVVRYRPDRGFTGTDSFTYRVNDGRFDSNVGTVSIAVTEPEGPTEPDNQPPVAGVTAPTSGIEGTAVTIDGSPSSDPDGDELALAWDLDADGEFDDGSGPTASLELADDGTQTVSLRVTDPDGASSVASTSVTAINAPPAIGGLPTTASATAGTVLRITGSVSDVPADTVTVVVDPGDGSPATPATVTDGRVESSHTFASPGTYPMTLTAVDDDGGTTSATVPVTVSSRERVLSPATIKVFGSVSVPDTGSKPDQIGLAGMVVGSKRSSAGVIAIARTGANPMALGSMKVTVAGTFVDEGVRYGQVTGTGVLGSGRTARKVTYELIVADAGPDRVWLTVKDTSGVVVTGLSIGGSHPTGGFPFAKGSASVTPRPAF